MKRKIRIMHLRSGGGLYGAERVILDLAAFSGESISNIIVSINNLNNPGMLAAAAESAGIKTENVPCSGRIDPGAIKIIGRMLEKHRPDILHCHDCKSGLYGMLAGNRAGVRLVATRHGFTRETPRARFYEQIEKQLHRRFDLVVAVSDEMGRKMKRNFPGRLRVVLNGIDTERFSPRSPDKELKIRLGIEPSATVVGTAGRLSPEKGTEILLFAALEVTRNFHGIRFLIAGDGALEKDLREKARKLGLGSAVIFAGSRNDMRDIYSCMDIFVLPSLREGLPLALLEAMSMGLPVIASGVGGIPSVISPGINGMLVDPGDSAGLGGALRELLAQKSGMSVLSENARNTVVERFSSVKMASEYGEIYREVI